VAVAKRLVDRANFKRRDQGIISGRRKINGQKQIKPGTGASLHTQEPVTVASFRTWRVWREYVA